MVVFPLFFKGSGDLRISSRYQIFARVRHQLCAKTRAAMARSTSLSSPSPCNVLSELDAPGVPKVSLLLALTLSSGAGFDELAAD